MEGGTEGLWGARGGGSEPPNSSPPSPQPYLNKGHALLEAEALETQPKAHLSLFNPLHAHAL